MRYNYHTHTDRCKHAVGREDDYIAVAIREGYDGLGISDHIILPGIIHGRSRGDWGTQDEYFA
ncbi:MAG: histidinol-phosphatase, partial [Clostridiales bacterium]|nr:histidinol-phosphatase [Candidatus Coliplasma caballi]